MLNILSVILAAFKYPLGKAAIVAILGIVIVFAVLGILVGILTLFKLFFGIDFTKFSKKKKVEQITAAPAPEQADENEEELVAVIAAAIACLSGEESAPAPFRIKSIKKIK